MNMTQSLNLITAHAHAGAVVDEIKKGHESGAGYHAQFSAHWVLLAFPELRKPEAKQ